jgi:hypothetical protein
MGYDNETRPWRKACYVKIVVWLILTALFVFLPGCAVREVCVLSYTLRAEVKPIESQPAAVVGSTPFPWDVVLDGISDIFTGARKKAIEEKVGYQESRSFTLFRIESGESPPEPSAESVKASEETSGHTDK